MKRAIAGLWIFCLGNLLMGQEKASPYTDEVDTLTGILSGGVGGVTVDKAGFIYVADFGEKVWKITPQGEVHVFVESMYGSSGNTVDSRGNLIQSNFYGNYLARVSRTGEVSVIADQAPMVPLSECSMG